MHWQIDDVDPNHESGHVFVRASFWPSLAAQRRGEEATAINDFYIQLGPSTDVVPRIEMELREYGHTQLGLR